MHKKDDGSLYERNGLKAVDNERAFDPKELGEHADVVHALRAVAILRTGAATAHEHLVGAALGEIGRAFIAAAFVDHLVSLLVDYAGNEHVVDPGNLNRVGTDEISILSSYRIVNTKQKMVVEGMLRFPQINLYSLDNDMNITLSMEPELRSKSSIENCSKSARRKYFGEIQSMENFFGAMYYDIPLKDFYDGSGKGAKILFFKWDGTPVLKINLAYIATSFFIYKNKLYVFSGSGEKECLKMYDCPSILTK